MMLITEPTTLCIKQENTQKKPLGFLDLGFILQHQTAARYRRLKIRQEIKGHVTEEKHCV